MKSSRKLAALVAVLALVAAACTSATDGTTTTAGNGDGAGSVLAAVRDRAQMTLLVPIPYPNRRRAPRPRARSGAEYLHAAAAARDVPQLAQLRSAVRRWVRDERTQSRGSIATVYHLVPRGAADRYRSALERAAREAGIRLRVLGPRLPYAFTDE